MEKKGARTFFQEKKGARSFFDIPKEGGQHFFSKESRGLTLLFWGEKGSRTFVSQEFCFGFDIGQNGNGF